MKIISSTFKVSRKCLENFVRGISIDGIFSEILFYKHLGYFWFKKRSFEEISFLKMSRTKFTKHFRHTLKVLEMVFRIRAMFLWFQNCCTTFLKLFIDEKRKLFCFYKKRRGYQRLFKGWKGGPWLLHESQKTFWGLQSKIGSVRLFKMF